MDKKILTIEFDVDTVYFFLREDLVEHGLQVSRSFQLEQACASFSSPLCPHNGIQECDCHLVTIYVQSPDGQSIYMVLHQHGQITEVWVDPASLEASPSFAEHVIQILKQDPGLVSPKMRFE